MMTTTTTTTTMVIITMVMMMMMLLIQGKGMFRQSEYPTFCNISAVTGGRESCNNRYVMESFLKPDPVKTDLSQKESFVENYGL
jgi:hypothetical protein